MSAERQLGPGVFVNESGTFQAQAGEGIFVNETVSSGAPKVAPEELYQQAMTNLGTGLGGTQ